MTKKFYTLLGTCCWAFALGAQVIFTSPTGSGSGSSWADPADLQSALAGATNGDELWLLHGTYYPTSCTICTFADREQRFELPSGVRLYGGFAGTETDVQERPEAGPATVLSGDIDQDGTGANNSFTILYTQHVITGTTVDGVTFRGGRADVAQADADSPYASGGAWYNQGVLTGNTSSPTARHCIFEDNQALRFGGAFYHHASFGGGGNIVLEGCTFRDNQCEGDGGAVYLEASFNGTSSAAITASTFTDNSAILGKAGAIMNQGGENGFAEVLLTDCVLSGNTAFSNGGAICNFGRNGNAGGTYTGCAFLGNAAVFGAAVYNNGSMGGTSSPFITDCDFIDGMSGNEAGAVYNNGVQGVASPQFSACRFYNNTADGSGGALFNNGVSGISSPRIDRCDFRNNVVTDYGAAIYNFGKAVGNASPLITNSLFYQNSATSAGAVYSLGSEGGNASPLFTNCTFVDNSASVGGAVYANGSDSTGTSAPVITNCIFSGNEAPTGRIFRAISAAITVRYSALDVADCGSAWTGIDGNVTCEGTVSYELDPQFENAAGIDFRLAQGSPLIDAGLNSPDQTGALDLNGNDRIVDGTVDLGAYEYGVAVVPPTLFLNQPQSATRCAGEDLSLTVEATGAGPLSYQWYRNDTLLSGETANELVLANLRADNAGAYYVAVTNAEGTSSSSAVATVTVSPTVFAEATLTATATTICPDESITFEAATVEDGPAPVYTWYLNGVPVADEMTVSWTVDSLDDGDQVFFTLLSNADCVSESLVTTDTLTISVTEALSPAVSFTASYTDTLCLDSLATFTATAVDAGAQPAYSWLLNGTATGDTTATYTSNTLLNGDELTVMLTSSAECAIQPTATADPLAIIAQACAPPVSVRELDQLVATAQPNPFVDQLHIQLLPTTESLQLRLSDAYGRVYRSQVIDSGTSRILVNTEELHCGTYVLTLTGRGTAYRQWLLKL